MAADTEPRKYQNLQHFFANYYNQLMILALGYPDPAKLKVVFADQAKLPDSCKSFTNLLFKELATGFSAIPQANNAAPDGGDLFAFRQAIMDGQDLGDFPQFFGDRHGAPRRPPNRVADRDPTAEEIETVTVMGYSVEEADAALRMANFDIQQAIEMLLVNIEEVVAFSERRAKEKQEELKRKEQEELDKALIQSMGVEEAKVEDELRTITHEEFDKASKEYKLLAFEQVIDSVHASDKQPQSHMQMTQLYISKLIEMGKKEDKEKFALAIFERAQNQFNALSASPAPMNPTQLETVLEFDMQLALTAIRDFNVDLKEHR